MPFPRHDIPRSGPRRWLVGQTAIVLLRLSAVLFALGALKLCGVF